MRYSTHSMTMTMVPVWKMGVNVRYWFVPVPMRVFSFGLGGFIMRMLMVFIMFVIMFVFDHLMYVLMAMPLSQMQPHAKTH